jgi:hypothetical protein
MGEVLQFKELPNSKGLDFGVLPLSRKQKRALARSNGRVNLLEGSIRSGKTFIMMMRWWAFIANDAPKRGALIMVGKSRDALYRNVFEPLDNDPTLAVFKQFISYKQGAPTAQMFGRTVHVVGAADAKAESKIRGMTVAGAFVDELTTLPQDFFRQLLGRMSVAGAKLFATTNPDSPNHWLKVEYLDKIGTFPDWQTWHFIMDDNPGLTSEYMESLKREYSGLWYRRFILGEWVAAEGAIYQEFDPERHVISPGQFPPMERVLMAGVDYGTEHKTRGYLIGMAQITLSKRTGLVVDPLHPEGMKQYALFVLSEFSPASATVGQHAAMFKTWLADQPHALWREPEWVAVDPAALVFRKELFDGGMTAIRAHNAVLPGIQTISSLFAAMRLFVTSEATELIRGLPGYRWDSQASAKGLTKPIKEADDEADALRYSVYTARRFWRDQIPLTLATSKEDNETEELEAA